MIPAQETFNYDYEILSKNADVVLLEKDSMKVNQPGINFSDFFTFLNFSLLFLFACGFGMVMWRDVVVS